MSKLTEGQKGLMRLILRSKADPEGWYTVSEAVWPAIHGKLPSELVEMHATDTGGRLKLTEGGKAAVFFL